MHHANIEQELRVGCHPERLFSYFCSSVFYLPNAPTESGLPSSTPVIQILNNINALYKYSMSTPTAHLAFAAHSPTFSSSMPTDISTLMSSRTTILHILPAITDIKASICGRGGGFMIVLSRKTA
ncbi:hypothetical protein BDQ12DRAFT_725969 [Crucibulum laeve]|uniref:Uncharacterized protein n=1 Tax=Crucibulum laeve TaxID=68775 RepID=A0A5C3LQK2_9AGAR|nr:hypothetical protein BDQ12DRAFT_725969 [Crucibulum laeve]